MNAKQCLNLISQLALAEHDGEPITFAEWGYLGKGKFQRRDFRLDALGRHFGGNLAVHHVDHAAGASLPIQHRGRAFQHFDAVQTVHIIIPGPIGACRELLQTIFVVGTAVTKATDHRAAHAQVARAGYIRLHAWGIGQGALNALRGQNL